MVDAEIVSRYEKVIYESLFAPGANACTDDLLHSLMFEGGCRRLC